MTLENNNEKMKHIKVAAFDADDTLWDCQSAFEHVQKEYCSLLSPWADNDTVTRSLLETEKANMPLLGFGCKAFTMSLIENAIKVTGGKADCCTLGKMLEIGKWLLRTPGSPLPDVENTLAAIRQRTNLKMIVFTKGEAIDQKNKMRRSGLNGYFDDVVITDEKTCDEYLRLCRMCNCRPEETVMVGNSFKSDIAPALSVGMNAIYIPYHTTWILEQAEEYDHPALKRVSRFADLLPLLAP